MLKKIKNFLKRQFFHLQTTPDDGLWEVREHLEDT